MNHSVKENVIVTILDNLRRFLFINEKEANSVVKDQVNSLAIKTDSIKKQIGLLSGGNQQKVVIAKWLANNSNILLMDEPTIGVDIGAKTEIIYRIRELADKGCAIVFVSSELNELLAVADRIIVLKDGKVIKEMNRKNIDNEEVLQRAIQGYE